MERVHAIQAHITNNYHWLCVQCSECITRWCYLSAKTIKMQRIFFAQVRYILMRVLIYRYIFFFSIEFIRFIVDALYDTF